uniref:CIDE-N domain-containing protein n=1 Tax=Callorhinchus milii TaxID=7868 RepID=A0A4W3H8Z2_CALMI
MESSRGRVGHSVCDARRSRSCRVSACSLQELLSEGKQKLDLDKLDEEKPSVVLEEDGTIVDDEDYFLCQPKNTMFMILRSDEEWVAVNVVAPKLELSLGAQRDDAADSLYSEDQLDSAEHSSNWRLLARQLQENLARIITMSESELQALIEAPPAELAKELKETLKGVEELQDTLQQSLDKREQQRQAKELLELYLKASAPEKAVVPKLEAPLGAQKGGATIGLYSEDQVDSAEHSSNWKPLARQFRENLARIITMSESELQALIKAPPAELAKELKETLKGAERLQNTLQHSLNKREEERQTKMLLEQYLKAEAPVNDDSEDAKGTDQMDCSNANSNRKCLHPHIIGVLEKKDSPEFSLSNEELQEVIKVDEAGLATDAHCSIQKAKNTKYECKKELEKRLSKMKALEELNANSESG